MDRSDIVEALITAILGWAVVFLGIALLVIVVVLVGKAMVASQKKPAPIPAAAAPAVEPVKVPEAPKAPGTAGELKLYGTPDRDAAMIMAIVADELKIPVNELRFISIKEVEKK